MQRGRAGKRWGERAGGRWLGRGMPRRLCPPPIITSLPTPHRSKNHLSAPASTCGGGQSMCMSGRVLRRQPVCSIVGGGDARRPGRALLPPRRAARTCRPKACKACCAPPAGRGGASGSHCTPAHGRGRRESLQCGWLGCPAEAGPPARAAQPAWPHTRLPPPTPHHTHPPWWMMTRWRRRPAGRAPGTAG